MGEGWFERRWWIISESLSIPGVTLQRISVDAPHTHDVHLKVFHRHIHALEDICESQKAPAIARRAFGENDYGSIRFPSYFFQRSVPLIWLLCRHSSGGREHLQERDLAKPAHSNPRCRGACRRGRDRCGTCACTSPRGGRYRC